MPVTFQTANIDIPPGVARQRTFSDSVTFGSRVRRAAVALNGFKLDFVGDIDRHINVLEANADLVNVFGNSVNFSVTCQYADFNFDDPYQGFITVLVIAEVD
jgi:hypothetical protein